MTLYLFSTKKNDVIIENVQEFWLTRFCPNHYKLYFTKPIDNEKFSLESVSFEPEFDTFSVEN